MFDLIERAYLFLKKWRFYFCNSDSHIRNRTYCTVILRFFSSITISSHLKVLILPCFKNILESAKRTDGPCFMSLDLFNVNNSHCHLRPKVCFITSVYFILVYVNCKWFFEIIVVFQKNKIIYFYVYNITYIPQLLWLIENIAMNKKKTKQLK